MKMNKAIIESELETVNVDKSLKASYVCRKDGLTTLVPLGTPVATIRCASCQSSKFMTRIFDDEDPDQDIANGTTMEVIENMKPQFRTSFKRDNNNNLITVTFPDDERGLGSFDPTAVMGFNQYAGIQQALQRHTQYRDRYTGEWKESEKNVLESLVERVREQRLTEQDVFANEPISATSVLVECDVPSELKVDLMHGNMQSFYMDVPDMSRKVKVLVNIPETSMEAMKREQRQSTKAEIIKNIANKVSRIATRTSNKIDDFQINTVNKYINEKPHPSNITYEDLASATKAMFWSATVESKTSIKDKDGIYKVLVPQKDKFDIFAKAMRTLHLSTIPPVEIPEAPKTSSNNSSTSMVKFLNEHTPFDNYNTVRMFSNGQYNTVVFDKIGSATEDFPEVPVGIPTKTVSKTNASDVERHLASITRSAKIRSFVTKVNQLAQRQSSQKSNDNSSDVDKSTPTPSISTKQNIFVYGSNLKGINGAGSALEAKKNHGAKNGIGKGLNGNAYAIPTKKEPYVNMSFDELKVHLHDFVDFVKAHPEMQFNMTRVGCGLAGFTPAQVAPQLKELANAENMNWEMSKDFLPFIKTDMKVKLGE